MSLSERLYQALVGRQAGAVGDQRQQQVVGRVPTAQHRMTQAAGASVLLIGRNAQVRGNARDRVEDVASARILNEALVAAHDAVRTRRVKAAPDASALARRKGRRRLEPKGPRVVHAAHVLKRGAVLLGHRRKQLLNKLLLTPELYGVGHGEPFAAAALLRNRACVRLESHMLSVAQWSQARSFSAKRANPNASPLHESLTSWSADESRWDAPARRRSCRRKAPKARPKCDRPSAGWP